MHRLFVAIRPPLLIRERLLALAGGIPGARWQDDDQLHLTLRFIGEVDRHRADDIAAALDGLHSPAVSLTLGTFGRFEHKGRPEALWIGAGPKDTLERLHAKVDRALVRAGLEPERRAYLPHITLARFGRSAVAFPLPPDPPSANFDVDQICLYESHLGRSGATYEIVGRYPLDPSGDSASLRARAAAPAVTSVQVSSKPDASP